MPILTSAIVLAKLYELNFISMNHAERIWKKILDINQILPKGTFGEYFEELYDEDNLELLKNHELV